MEFNGPDDATNAASQPDHVINHKKASVQFFKAKDPQPTHKKGQNPAEGIEKFEGRINHYGTRFGVNSSSIQEVIPQKGGFCNTEFEYGVQTSTYSALYNQSNHVGDLSTCKKSIIVQPSEVRASAHRRWYNDFYLSLGRAEEARYYHATYAAPNLRFSRQRYVH